VHSLEDQIKTLKGMLKMDENDDPSLNATSSAAHLTADHVASDRENGSIELEAKSEASFDALKVEPDSPEIEGPKEARSKAAMEDLSSLMLKVGVDNSGEPSFTIASGVHCNTETSALALVPELWQAYPPYRRDVWSNNVNVFQDPVLRGILSTSFMKSFNPDYQFFGSELPGTIPSGAFFSQSLTSQLLESTICAVGAYFTPGVNVLEIRSAFVQHAESVLMTCCREFPSENVVQALSLMAWLETVAGKNDSGWIYNCEYFQRQSSQSTITDYL
jgi:hypothetical protein